MYEKFLKRQFFLVLADIFLINIAVFFALALRFDGQIPEMFLDSFKQAIIYITVLKLIIFYFFGLYRNLWQYASVIELINITVAVTVSSLLMYSLRAFGIVLPRGIYIIDWVLAILLIGGVRFALRIVQDVIVDRAEGYLKKVLIIGAGEAGVMVAKEIDRNRHKLLSKPAGYIDDDPKKKGKFIHNVPILGGREHIPQIIKEKGIDEIIIAIPSAPQKSIRQIVDVCKDFQVKLKILPGVFELIDEKVSLKKMRDVDIEDLLRRESVKANLSEIVDYIKDEVVLVSGGGGSIGSELCRQILKYNPKKLVLFGHGENSVFNIHKELTKKFPNTEISPVIGSVQEKSRIEDAFSFHKPTLVFHAAAHKHVPLMEKNLKEAIRNNILGTRNLALVSHKHGSKHFVLISTDKAVNATSIMGATKRVAEMIIQAIARFSETKFCAVRFGNVLGSRGSVVLLFREQIADGGPVTITHPDMVRYFMTIPEAVQLVIQAGAMGKNGEIFVLNMGEPVKILDLANDLIKLSGYEPGKDIDIVYTGIRPGEKLYEEMLTAQEEISTTTHEKIYIAKSNGSSELLKELVHISKLLQMDHMMLAGLIPGLDREINIAVDQKESFEREKNENKNKQ